MSDAIYGMPGAGPWMAPLVIGLVALGLGAWSLAVRVWRKRQPRAHMPLSWPSKSQDRLRHPLTPGEVVCLCGSTRFKEQLLQEAQRLTLQGDLVVMPHVFGHADGLELSPEVKDELDGLHLTKIELADSVRVVDVGGYVGPSTQAEIRFALKLGRPVSFYSETHP